MPITNRNPQAADEFVEQYTAAVRRAILYKMTYVGEQTIIAARTQGNYTDRTGNLRSSIGYVIIEDGKIVNKSTFEVVKNGSEGAAEGAKFINRLVSEFPKGMVLVVCAGMKYAAFVAAKGFNVIDSAELLAQRLVPKIITQLGLKRA